MRVFTRFGVPMLRCGAVMLPQVIAELVPVFSFFLGTSRKIGMVQHITGLTKVLSHLLCPIVKVVVIYLDRDAQA